MAGNGRAIAVIEPSTGIVLAHSGTANVALDVNKEMTHDPTWGAQLWFSPLASTDHAMMGMTDQNAFTGATLGTKWSDPNKRSAFFGTFAN